MDSSHTRSGRSHKGSVKSSTSVLKEYDVGFPRAVEEIESVQERMVQLVESLERGEEEMVHVHRYNMNDLLRKMVSIPDPFDKKQFMALRKQLVSQEGQLRLILLGRKT
jgi:hypothetical protein